MSEPVPASRLGLWQRLWSPEPTSGQVAFDFVFGVVAPLLCLIFDPVVFRNTGPCAPAILSGYAVFAYTAIGLGMITLTVWLVARRQISRGSAFMAGVFFTGALFSAGLGIILLPWTVIGLVICLGALGLMPFVTALVYWRNGLWAWRWSGQQNPARPNAWLTAVAAAGLVIVLGVPALAQWQAPHLWPALASTSASAEQCAAAE